ncbi:MAG: DUF3656 domain-containing protein [Firmicutes bacterium]|nr:DUF3656 domain-containing protein [Bacillota bacterium]
MIDYDENKIHRKLELLSPAGSRAAFDAALNAGADAIYLGTDKFNARRGAENFSLDELTNVIKQAHLRNVMVYITFNTIISDEELPVAVERLAAVCDAGADAVIVQDWGLFNIIKRIMPNLPVHASTQMNAHNTAMVKLLEEKGAKRVTLARELSIGEIEKICASTALEIEAFIHGALCFSYSGQCLFSSMVGNRSGNRGLCPQACRMGYELVVAGKKEEVWPIPGRHILSTRDLCGIRLIPELAKAGVTALKIEGRMKSPEYVATVTRIYRSAIDRYTDDPDRFTITDDEIDELQEAFSRGFTEGYFKKIRDARMMSFERPNDRGIFLGRVTYLDVYKAKLGIQIRRELCVGDEIEIWVTKGGRIKVKVEDLFIDNKLVKCAPAGSKVVITIKAKRHKIKAGDRVFRTYNVNIAKKAKDAIQGADAKRIPISVSAYIEVGEPIVLKASVIGSGTYPEVEIKSEFPAERAERRTLSEDDVITQLNRLGNTVYKVESWDIHVGSGVMVPLGKLNDLRRGLTRELDNLRLSAYERPKISIKKARDKLLEIIKPEPVERTGKPALAADISNIGQAHKAAEAGADWIYIRPGLSRVGGPDLSLFSELRSSSGIKLALATGNIIHEHEAKTLVEFIKDNNVNLDALLVDNIGMFYLARGIGLPIILDYHINNFNMVSTRFFKEAGAFRITLSPELALDQIAVISNSVDVESESLVHGWLEIMTAEHCVPSTSKGSCNVCSSRKFYIIDQKGFKFPVEQDTECRSHIYNSHELYMLPNIEKLISAGIASMRLLLNRYEPEAVGEAVSLYRRAIDLISSGVNDITPVLKQAERTVLRDTQTTTGHFFRPTQ